MPTTFKSLAEKLAELDGPAPKGTLQLLFPCTNPLLSAVFFISHDIDYFFQTMIPKASRLQTRPTAPAYRAPTTRTLARRGNIMWP